MKGGKITRLSKGKTYDGKYTKEEFEEIMLTVAENETDFHSAMYNIFLTRANGDPEQAFKDLLEFALQFFNLNFHGRTKPQDEKEEDQKVMQDFIDNLPKGKRPSYGQFEKHHKGEPPIGNDKFYKLLKKIKR